MDFILGAFTGNHSFYRTWSECSFSCNPGIQSISILVGTVGIMCNCSPLLFHSFTVCFRIHLLFFFLVVAFLAQRMVGYWAPSRQIIPIIATWFQIRWDSLAGEKTPMLLFYPNILVKGVFFATKSTNKECWNELDGKQKIPQTAHSLTAHTEMSVSDQGLSRDKCLWNTSPEKPKFPSVSNEIQEIWLKLMWVLVITLQVQTVRLHSQKLVAGEYVAWTQMHKTSPKHQHQSAHTFRMGP